MGLRVTWMHPLASEDDHAYILEDAGVRTLFVDPGPFAGRAAALRARVPGLERLYGLGPGLDGAEDVIAACAGLAPAPLVSRARADDPCTLIYTGGTTGRPKAWSTRSACT
jgi:fatty-acyl-CoA synthase